MPGEPWQLFLAWFAVQLLQTVQIALVGRKVTKTLMPPPMAAAAAYCRNCGSLTQSRALSADGLCSHCGGGTPTQPTRRR